LNEWNYLPDHDWGPVLGTPGRVREQWYARQGGMEGAAFAAAVLMDLQDAPLDVANYYGTDNQPFGLFTVHGSPKRTFYGFKAFRSLLDTPMRVTDGRSSVRGLVWLAGLGLDHREASVLAALPRGAESLENIRVEGLPWSGRTAVTVTISDAKDEEARRTLTWENSHSDLRLALAAPGLVLLRFRPARTGSD
jgi:hypothetical protein